MQIVNSGVLAALSKKMLKVTLTSLILTLGSVQGAILFIDIPDIELLSGDFSVSRDFDLDDNTVSDVRFISDRNSIRVESLNPNTRVAMVISPAPDTGGLTVAFERNSSIGGILGPDETWSQTAEIQGNSILLACRNIGCIGQYGTGVRYAGIQITDEEGNERYGWVELNLPLQSQSGTINSFAFETAPNTSIFAGVIPEPSSLLHVCLSLPALLRRRR